MEQNFFIYPAAYDTYIEAKTSCLLSFPMNNSNSDIAPQREFREWYEVKPGSWFQGQVDSEGRFDGKGILVEEEWYLVIANWRQGEELGKFTEIYYDGVMDTDAIKG